MSDFPTFDELLKLAQENPEKLEAYRQEQVEKLISQAPEGSQRRLRGLQFQIDAQRQIHHESPMGSCMSISKMMQESFTELRTGLNQITGVNDPLRNEVNSITQEDKLQAGKILSFPSR